MEPHIFLQNDQLIYEMNMNERDFIWDYISQYVVLKDFIFCPR